MPTPQEILDRLRSVPYPGYTRDVVSFGVVRDIEVGSDAIVVQLAPSTANEEVVAQIEAAVRAAVASMPGVTLPVTVERQAAPTPQARRGAQPIAGVARVLAVASGKGGVGKSTVATNLALAFASMGLRTGLLDADVYGPSVALMLGVTEKGRVGDGKRLVPVERHGIRVLSMAMFVGDTTPIIWRGPMVTKLVTEFLHHAEWGELDVLVLDLPPGTGDVQLTLQQQVQMTGGVIVTTPQDVALADVRRGIQMFRQMKTPVLGVIENMSFHVCPGCGAEAHLFGAGGGARMAKELGIPFLGELPLVTAVRQAGDSGTPLVAAEPAHPVSRAFHEVAERTLVRLNEAQRETQAPSLRVVG